jgi:hypothetical protein
MTEVVDPDNGNKYHISVGADVEFFLKEKDSGKLVSAYGIVPGTKDAPYPVPKGAVQVDGMAVEFNINPAFSAEEFLDNVNTVMAWLKDFLPNYDFVISPVAEFGKELIESQPKIARELGCMADYDAYTGKKFPSPNSDVDFRTAAGHIHIGWTNDAEGWTKHVDPLNATHFEACQWLTLSLDQHVGMVSTLMCGRDNYEAEKKRRSLYGKPGAFRPKSYGVEYRTPSNSWVKEDRWVLWVYESVINSFKAMLKDAESRTNVYYDKRAKTIIEEIDVTTLKYLLNFNTLPAPVNFGKDLKKVA